jgi:hypothetical protein
VRGGQCIAQRVVGRSPLSLGPHRREGPPVEPRPTNDIGSESDRVVDTGVGVDRAGEAQGFVSAIFIIYPPRARPYWHWRCQTDGQTDTTGIFGTARFPVTPSPSCLHNTTATRRRALLNHLLPADLHQQLVAQVLSTYRNPNVPQAQGWSRRPTLRRMASHNSRIP